MFLTSFESKFTLLSYLKYFIEYGIESFRDKRRSSSVVCFKNAGIRDRIQNYNNISQMVRFLVGGWIERLPKFFNFVVCNPC